MAMMTLDGAKALENARRSDARWPARGSRGNRIEPIARPTVAPTFSFPAGATVFTMGSCFARNVEVGLVERGFRVPTRSNVWYDTVGRPNEDSFLNVYGVPSMLNELRWALGEGDAYDPAKHLIEVFPGRYCDPHMGGLAPLGTRDDLIAQRERMFASTRTVLDADVAILTLGLAETWIDRETGVYLNTPRSVQALVPMHPGRFEFRVLSYREIVESLDASLDLIFRRSRPEMRIVLTVSPVPLSATFTGQDVAVANQYSKSVLRAAAEHAWRKHERIDYFPSYESIVLSDRQQAWEDDQIHVRLPAIEANVEALISAYVDARAEPAAAGDADAPLAAMRKAMRDKRYADVVRMAKSADANPATTLPMHVEALIADGRAAEAFEVATAASLARPADPAALALIGKAYAAQGRLDDAVRSTWAAVDLGPHRLPLVAQLVELLHRSGDTEAAKGILSRMRRAHPSNRAFIAVEALLKG